MFGSLQILYFEKDAPGANITDASDALSFTIVTNRPWATATSRGYKTRAG